MDNISKGIATYSFDLDLQISPRNFVSHFLLSRWLEIPWSRLVAMSDQQKYRRLNQMLASFWFVGVHTDCERVIAAIGSELGEPPIAELRNTSNELQGRTGWWLATAEALSPRRRASMPRQHRLDHALWQEWRRRDLIPRWYGPDCSILPIKPDFSAMKSYGPGIFCAGFAKRRLARLRAPGEASAAMIERADRARDTGQWEDAAICYRDALPIVPDAWAIWVQYGHALKENERIAEAENAYRQSLNLSQQAADTHLQLGHTLKLDGSPKHGRPICARPFLIRGTRLPATS